jgi:hypothetical protein
VHTLRPGRVTFIGYGAVAIGFFLLIIDIIAYITLRWTLPLVGGKQVGSNMPSLLHMVIGVFLISVGIAFLQLRPWARITLELGVWALLIYHVSFEVW